MTRFIAGFLLGLGALFTVYAIQSAPVAAPVIYVLPPLPGEAKVAPAYSSAPELRFSKVARGAKYRELKVKATAYTAHDEGMDGKGITYSGLPVDLGVIAVDPAVIPLGSVVYVPEIGYCVALDRGGAIKGNRIDVYMRSKERALEWGVREVTVRVYGEEK